MNSGQPISFLLFGTLGVVILIAVVLLLRFRAKQPHHPMDGQRERNIDEIRNEAPPRD